MFEKELYEFDTLGYVTFKNIVSAESLDALHYVFDRYRDDPELVILNSHIGKKENLPEEQYISNMIEADQRLHELMRLEPVIDFVRLVMAGNIRVNHSYGIQRFGSGGYTYLHMGGTPIHPKATYSCVNGKIHSLLTKIVIPVSSTGVEDGCFAVIPGSHKANFPRPSGDHPDENKLLVSVEASPGDVIVFSEALCHGSFVKTTETTRKTFYICYSAGFMPDWGRIGLSHSTEFINSLDARLKELVKLYD